MRHPHSVWGSRLIGPLLCVFLCPRSFLFCCTVCMCEFQCAFMVIDVSCVLLIVFHRCVVLCLLFVCSWVWWYVMHYLVGHCVCCFLFCMVVFLVVSLLVRVPVEYKPVHVSVICMGECHHIHISDPTGRRLPEERLLLVENWQQPYAKWIKELRWKTTFIFLKHGNLTKLPLRNTRKILT